MELDTGAAISILSEETFKDLFPECTSEKVYRAVEDVHWRETTSSRRDGHPSPVRTATTTRSGSHGGEGRWSKPIGEELARTDQAELEGDQGNLYTLYRELGVPT